MGAGVFCPGKRGWVVCDTAFETAFFILEIFRATHRAGLGGGCMPRRWIPQPTAHPDRLHSTGSSTGRAREPGRGKYQGRPHTGTHARTLDTLHRSALDTRQAAPGRSGRCKGWRACNADLLHTQHFCVLVRLILNILLTCTFNRV